MTRKACLAVALLALAGCGGTPQIAMAPSIEQAPEGALPAPDGLDASGGFVYALGPQDSVSIEVDGLPDLLRPEVVIDGEGMLSYPIAGSVRAQGLTTTQLARALEDKLRQAHVRDPRVSVNLVTQSSNFLTVDGQVNKPGLYPVYRDMTLMQAVALASGETDFARTSAVLIFRDVGAQQYVGLYNLNGIRYGNYADPKVYPQDKIVVSDDEARRLLQTLGPFVSLVTTPLVYLINQNR